MLNTSQLTPAQAALRDYDTAIASHTAGVVITALQWRDLGVRLWAASHQLSGQRQVVCRDRGNDAHARADAARSEDERIAVAALAPAPEERLWSLRLTLIDGSTRDVTEFGVDADDAVAIAGVRYGSQLALVEARSGS